MPSTRRAFLVRAGAVAAVTPFGLAACSAGTKSAAGGTGSLVFGKTDGGTTFVRNFNVFGPAINKAPNPEMIYESLARIDYSDGAAVKPWLAKSLSFDTAGTTLTVVLRDDVTFSDGTKMTADDVVFSMEIPLQDPTFNMAGTTYDRVAKVDDSTVTVHWSEPAFSELNQLASIYAPVVPKHLWASQDLKSWTNPNPIGTGLYTLERFASQQVTLAARTDYWGGQTAVSQLKIIPTSGDALEEQLLRADVDWALAAWPNAQTAYVAPDPTHHLFQKYATGGAYAMFFNTAQAPFDNVHLRRALAMTIPRTEIVTTLGRPGTEAGPTGLVDQIYSKEILPQYRGKVQQVDGAGAMKELALSGFTVQGGKLVKDGKTYSPKLSYNTDYGWDPYANMMIRSWQKLLGITVAAAGAPGANLLQQQQTGDFDLTISTTGGAGVAGVYSELSSKAYLPIGQKASGNYGRWKDAATDAAVATLQSSNDATAIQDAADTLETIVAEQVPYSPIYESYWFVLINAKHWSGWPTPANFTYVPFLGMGPDSTMTLLNLKKAA
ncbi:MAG TPA: ABC transporter substrate-binding protein [Actinospica sp.]|jgi:peptide/nickel transport system substrate-binding protein|nr:ABC transporter substrate-binding protein [Actinospica sp.]